MAEKLRKPSLIVVTGQPGSGKTTLAHSLAKAIRCPAICRDEIKEGLVHTIDDSGEQGANLQLRATDLFFDTLSLLLGRGVSLVAEAAFQHRIWVARLEPLRLACSVRLVLCECSHELARARQVARGFDDPDRVRYHPEPAVSAATYEPPIIDVPMLNVDTSDGYRPAFEVVVEFARS